MRAIGAVALLLWLSSAAIANDWTISCTGCDDKRYATIDACLAELLRVIQLGTDGRTQIISAFCLNVRTGGVVKVSAEKD